MINREVLDRLAVLSINRRELTGDEYLEWQGLNQMALDTMYQHCLDCGSTHLEHRQIITCTECGCVQADERVYSSVDATSDSEEVTRYISGQLSLITETPVSEKVR